ncbi:MAG: hypothetical protein WDZ83_01320 [Rhizobiaceae bacterium]
MAAGKKENEKIRLTSKSLTMPLRQLANLRAISGNRLFLNE